MRLSRLSSFARLDMNHGRGLFSTVRTDKFLEKPGQWDLIEVVSEEDTSQERQKAEFDLKKGPTVDLSRGRAHGHMSVLVGRSQGVLSNGRIGQHTAPQVVTVHDVFPSVPPTQKISNK